MYGEYEALIEIRTGAIIAGKLPKKQLNKVLEYLELHHLDLEDIFLQLNPRFRL